MPEPVDFAKVEALREHLLIGVKDMASLLGVSRISYFHWVKGAPVGPRRDASVRKALKKLLVAVTQHNWPTPEVANLTAKARFQRLRELLDTIE